MNKENKNTVTYDVAIDKALANSSYKEGFIDGVRLKEQEFAKNKVIKANTLNKKRAQTEITKNLGPFVFIYYNQILNLAEVNKGKFSSQYMYRFIVLASLVNYKNHIKYPSFVMKTERTVMNSTNIPKLLGISKGEWSKTKKALVELGLIEEQDEKYIIINSQYACRGESKMSKTQLNIQATKVFKDGILEINAASDVKDQKWIGLLVDLMPYINKYHNIICSPEQIDEKDVTKLNPYSLKEIADALGKTKKRDRDALLKSLLDAQFNGRRLSLGIMSSGAIQFVINPKIIYQANRTKCSEGLDALIKLFDINWK